MLDFNSFLVSAGAVIFARFSVCVETSLLRSTHTPIFHRVRSLPISTSQTTELSRSHPSHIASLYRYGGLVLLLGDIPVPTHRFPSIQ